MKNKKTVLSEDERGLVGIGTLIIFIAMVIVAAVAAGVLINTSQSLQEQARKTGEETIRSVSSGVEINAVKGQTNENAKITSLEAVVSTYPGSDGINLGETVIQIKTPKSMEHITSENFTMTKIENVSKTANNLLGPGDTTQITIDNAETTEDITIGRNDSVSLTFLPPRGFNSYYGLVIPPALNSNTWYEL